MIPKKNGKWMAILHLSAPEGHSVNDHINKDEFSIHYSSVDDAVALLSQYGQDALMTNGSGLRIHFHCDNLIVQAWARQSAKHPDLM